MNAKKGRRSGGAQRQAGQDMSVPIDIAISTPVAPLSSVPGDVQSHIGRQLRSLYDSVVQQPVPDRFLELLSKLDEESGGKKDQE
jgi:hypothetical protein